MRRTYYYPSIVPYSLTLVGILAGVYVLVSLSDYSRDFARTRVNQRIVVLEVDDWYPRDRVFAVPESPATDIACDLRALSALLLKRRGALGMHPQMTLNLILTEPAFDEIAASGYRRYSYKPLDVIGTDVLSAIKQGMDSRVFFPQGHAREHFNALRWLRDLQDGDQPVLEAFAKHQALVPLPYLSTDPVGSVGDFSLSARINYLYRARMSPLIPFPDEAPLPGFQEYIHDWSEAGQSIFRNCFGFSSRSWIAPCYCWTEDWEQEAVAADVRYIQGGDSYTYAVNSSGQPIIKRKYFGDRSPQGLIYLERNILFEPKLGDDAIARRTYNAIHDAWRRNLPAVLTGHANKYLGSQQGAFGRQKLGDLLSLLESDEPVYLNSEQMGVLAENGELTITGSNHGELTITTNVPLWKRFSIVVLHESRKQSLALALFFSCVGSLLIIAVLKLKNSLSTSPRAGCRYDRKLWMKG